MLLPRQSGYVERASSMKQEGRLPIFGEGGVTLSSSGGGGGSNNPPPGCYPNGTECRGWIQNMVYCCPGGTTWKREEGWCVGWWDALPCR
jgi:hypothetical protein